MKDVIIIGGGPAGLSAAIYATRGGLSTLVLEGNTIGGTAADINALDNYPGFNGKHGKELTDTMKQQAMSSGAEIITNDAERITSKDDIFTVYTQTNSYKAKAIILATGRKRKSMPMYDKMYGKGVSYCAVCDGFFYKDAITVVIGSGNTAVSDAVYLSNICKTVYLINQKGSFGAEGDLFSQLTAHENIHVLYNTSIKNIIGEDEVKGITAFDLKEKAEKQINCDGIFVAMGHVAEKPLIDCKTNEKGEIITHGATTSFKGVFAAGDITDNPLKQVVTAAAQGATAAEEARAYINNNFPTDKEGK